MFIQCCSTTSHFLCWEGPWYLVFWMKFEGSFGQKWHTVDHTGIVYDIERSFNNSYIPREGYETFKQQWIFSIAAQHLISCTERAPGIWYFAWNLRVVLNRNDTIRTMRALYMMSKSITPIVYYVRKGMEHSSSNGCLSLQHSIPVFVLRGYLKYDILHEIW